MGTTPDRIIEIAARHAVYFEGLKTGYVKAFDKFLKEMRRDILARIRKISNPDSMNAKRLNALLRAVDKAAGKGFAGYEKVWRAQIAEVGGYAAEFEVKALGKVLKVDFSLPTPTQIANAAFTRPLSVNGVYGGALLDAFFADVAAKTATRVTGAIRLAAAQGSTTQELVRALRGTRANRFRDGIMDLTRRDAEMIARTSLHHASNTAREAVWAENSGIIEQVEFLAVLDSRTTEPCRSLSGRRFDIDKGPVPPLHINCRSNRVPVFKDGLDFLDGAGTQFSRGADGVSRVSPDMTYYEWLKTQPKGFQDSVIGPERGALLRDGGISSSRFAELQLNKEFRPLTLDEMRKLAPLAFEQAGI